MKRPPGYLFPFVLFLLTIPFGPARAQQPVSYKWWNPSTTTFPVLEGQGWPKEVETYYDRFPARAKKTVRPVVWHLSQDAAGLVLRFRTNAPEITVRYTVSGALSMPHMSSTGVSGLDLYALNKNGGWEWDGGYYHFGDTISYHFTGLKHDYEREYHLYLPLYNHVKWMEIGVPDSSTMTPLPVRPDKPIVIYGTSIAQGACASRPGMAWTSILGRRLHDPVINLAFSGNGRLEESVVSLVSELDPKIFVVDCLPNMSGFADDTIGARLVKTVRTLRNLHPDVPVLIVEHADASIGSLDTRRVMTFDRVNHVGDSAFTSMKAEGMQDIYLLTSQEIGLDMESTVEGLHPNDYGMELYAAAYEKKIRQILHEPIGLSSTEKPCIQYRSKVYDWEARHREELELNQKHPPKIVFLGNSITHYWGGQPVCAKIHRGQDSWEKYFKPPGVQNFGFSWDRIENVLWRIYHGELDGYQARQIMMMIGTNNLAFNTDQQIIDGIRLLIRGIKQRQSTAKILIIGIYPRRAEEDRVRRLNEALVRLCGSENVGFANPGVKLTDTLGKTNESLFVDGLHPNEKGYQILAKALQPYLVSGHQ